MIFGDFQFDEPEKLKNWIPQNDPGIYAILIPERKPSFKRYKVIYFGETENFANNGFPKSHDRYRCWINEAEKEEDVYIATCMMPETTSEQRRAIETLLYIQYKPNCNRI